MFRKTMVHLIALTFSVLVGIGSASSSTWNPPPTVFRNPDVVGIGFLGISSGFEGGVYVDGNGVRQTANVSMSSTAEQINANSWLYTWTLFNHGTGDFVDYFDTGNGPNFLQFTPLKAGQMQVDTRIGGRPVIGHWGGRWNPEMDPAAARLEPGPIPLAPAGIMLLAGIGCFGLLSRRRRTGRTN